jgi:hypothetical protein
MFSVQHVAYLKLKDMLRQLELTPISLSLWEWVGERA